METLIVGVGIVAGGMYGGGVGKVVVVVGAGSTVVVVVGSELFTGAVVFTGAL